MAAQPYTFRIAYVEGAPKSVTYTVPERKRVVVTNILAAAGGAASAQCFVAVHGIYAYTFFAPAPYAADRADVKLVAYERETIVLLSAVAEMRAMVTGYIFQDDVGKPPASDYQVKLMGPGTLPAGVLSAGRPG